MSSTSLFGKLTFFSLLFLFGFLSLTKLEFLTFIYSNSILLICALLLGCCFLVLSFPSNIKEKALTVSSTCFFITLLIFANFSPYCTNFQFFNEYTWLNNSFLQINLMFGLDGFSIYFFVLTSFIIPICIFLEYRNSDYFFQKGFLISLLVIELALFIAFSTLDLLVFFLSFESILIPMFLMVGTFGSNKRRIKASFFFFMYSFLFSLFSLLLIFYIYYVAKTTNILLLSDYLFNSNQQILAWGLMFITFSAKIPMFPFHIWLPEAHVEAPTIGSMILASLLLKLGGYGFLRFSLGLFPEGTFFFLPLIQILAILSVLYASFAAIYQTDLKKIVAYSSIAHMNVAILGLFSMNVPGIQGSIFTMVSHGIISAALFLLIGILYDRYNTRSIVYFGGICQINPILSSFFFFFMVCNIAFPGTSAFVGEFLTFVGIFSSNVFVFFTTIVGSFLCVVYSIRTFSFVCFGTIPSNLYYKFEIPVDTTREEFYSLLIFAIMAIFLGIKPSLFLDFSYATTVLLLSCYV